MFFSRKAREEKLDLTNIPIHIAAVMDGNGRWAKKRNLPRKAGHSAGSDTFKKAAEHLKKLGVKYFTVYAFSTENWNRPQDEVDAIMALLEKFLKDAIDEMTKSNIRLCFWGDLTPLPPGLKELIAKSNEVAAANDGFLVNVCLNYGGRREITYAAQKLAQKCVAGELSPQDITEELISKELYSANIPDPDLMIRPGAELRLSNFLLWQNAYSEFYFTKTLWPDMDEEELDKAIIAYQKRKRRFGGI